MWNSITNYIKVRDWRLIVIEIISLALAVLSALLLESKFFKIFIKDEFGATALAILIVAGVTFSAHVFADFLKRKKIGKFHITLLSVGYIGVLVSLLAMSNYTMKVSKTEKHTSSLKTELQKLDDLPKIKEAKAFRDKTIESSEIEKRRIKNEIANLIEREISTGDSYVTKKQVYEKQLQGYDEKIVFANAEYSRIREIEEKRLEQFSSERKNIDKLEQESSLGKLLAENPAILAVLALVILFLASLSFDPCFDSDSVAYRPALEPMAQVESQEEILSHSRKLVRTTAEVPVSQVLKKTEPSNLDEACLFYAQGRISAETGWSQRRIAKDFADGNVSLVHAKIKRFSYPLLSSKVSVKDSNSV